MADTVSPPRLVALTQELAGIAYPLGERTVIGRAKDADVFLPDITISRTHCAVEKTADGFLLRDMGSRLGTRLNDRAVQTAVLRPGDVLRVGKFSLRFEVPGQAPAPGPQAENLVGVPTMASPGQAPRGLDLGTPRGPGAAAGPGTPGGPRPGTRHGATVAFSDREATNLKMFDAAAFNLADQIGTGATEAAIHKLREHLDVVNRFSESIQTTLDVDSLVEQTLEALFGVFGKMEAGVVFLKEEKTGAMQPVASRHREDPDEEVDGVSRTILTYVQQTNQSVLSLDAQHDERFQAAESVMLGAMRTHMCVPLVCRDELVGAVYLLSPGVTAAFGEDDLRLLTALSSAVAVSLKNAQLAQSVEKEASLRAGLQRYISPELAEMYLENKVDLSLGGDRREGVCMFCDLVGFTTLSEQLPAQRLSELLNRYFERMMEVIFRHGGSLNKFGGDSMLAVWGVLSTGTVQPRDVLDAAFQMQNQTFALNAELHTAGLEPVGMTIGLNAGEFFAGNIGSQDRMEFTVIGDTINVAARIQALAHSGQVLTSMEVLESLGDQVGLFTYGEMPIRGREGRVAVASVRALERSREGDRVEVACCVPVRVPAGGADAAPGELTHGQMIAAYLAPDAVEVDILCGAPMEPGRQIVVYCGFPEKQEWQDQPLQATAVRSDEDADQHGFVTRLRLTDMPEPMRQVLTPGTSVAATSSLRMKV